MTMDQGDSKVAQADIIAKGLGTSSHLTFRLDKTGGAGHQDRDPPLPTQSVASAATEGVLRIFKKCSKNADRHSATRLALTST